MDPNDPELILLARGNGDTDVHAGARDLPEHQKASAPLYTRDAGEKMGQTYQRGLLGSVLNIHADRTFPTQPMDPRLYLNLNAPSSGLVCGVQGSGKSHSVSCMLESALIKDKRIGSLVTSLATLIFHFDAEGNGQPCEAAFLTKQSLPGAAAVQDAIVLVSPSNLVIMKEVYASTANIVVKPLFIKRAHLTAQRMLSMMGCNDPEKLPLYLHTVLSVLRKMGPKDFSYKDFEKQVMAHKFDLKQSSMLQLRFELLDSYLATTDEDITYFLKPGRMVIVDLTDPFLDTATANMLFHVCLGLFMEKCAALGKLIVVDEAHKYLGNNPESSPSSFVSLLCSIIRQQRHLGARVIVSTQEPTLIPSSILGLLSWIICHRFQSPSWVEFLGKYVPHRRRQAETSETLSDDYDWKDGVLSLQTGQTLLFASGAMLLARNGDVKRLGTGYLKIRIRPRITCDGGVSVFAVGPTAVPVAAVESKGSTGRSTTTPVLTLTTKKGNVIDLTGPSPTHSNMELPADPMKQVPSHPNKNQNAAKMNGESMVSVGNHAFPDRLSSKSAARNAETFERVSRSPIPGLDLDSLDNSKSEKLDRLMHALPRVRRVVAPSLPSQPRVS